MKKIDKNNQNIVNSETCGELLEVLNLKGVPVSVTQAVNLRPTKPHYHKVGTEIFWVRKGEITVKVDESEPVKICSGEVLVISPNEVHEVVETSDDNEVIVINNPRWEKGDEYQS